MARITMDQVESAFCFVEDMDFNIVDEEKAYINTEFQDCKSQPLTFDINLRCNITIELRWDVTGKSLGIIESGLIGVINRFGVMIIPTWQAEISTQKQYAYKFTTIKNLIEDSRKFLQAIIILDGLCKK